VGVGQLLTHLLGNAHRVGDFHRAFSFLLFGRNLKIDAVVVASGNGQLKANQPGPEPRVRT
jgi:hypothetical protein